MHDTAMNFVRDQLAAFKQSNDWTPKQLLVEFGAYNVNGTIRDLFEKSSIGYIGVDLQEGPHVHIVKDASKVTKNDIGSRNADIVVSTNVFEHVKDWPSIVNAAYNLLRPGGWFVVQCAGPGFMVHSGKVESPFLEPDEWYRNVPHEELADVMKEVGFTHVETAWREQWPQDTTGVGIK